MLLPSLAQINDARTMIASSAIRTPLVRLNFPEAPAEIYLKLENLQPIGSFKIRGATNAMGHLSAGMLSRGVLTASAGNMAQGVAWRARELGIPCTVVAPETAPDTKVRAIERLGGHVIKVPFEDWWRAFEERAFPGVDATFIHAFDDLNVMAGNGTIALEIVEELPELDAIVIPWGGGGLTCGIASALRALNSKCRIYAAEVATAAPLAASWAAGSPQAVDYQPSFVDGIGARLVFPEMFDRARELIDGSLVADLDQVASALRLIA
ncbi:MAG TPA: pyridoxal-phosphate dependent enzyme, partial [Pyrinomonadaceae bacterium]|nr:pyridoxal-phosphate dependent enzyme [Pyrinomonadaceae bacterium]